MPAGNYRNRIGELTNVAAAYLKQFGLHPTVANMKAISYF
jgi:hypothetical protein